MLKSRPVWKVFIAVLLLMGTVFVVRHMNHPRLSVPRTESVRFLVVHSFALPVPDMIRVMKNLGVSTHYLIDTDGNITSFIPEDQVAFHAGSSSWRGQSGLNASSVGIELQSPTLGQTPFPKPQIRAFQILARSIIDRYNLPKTHIVAHSDIAPMRKVDVGSAFPWRELAAAGIGFWPTDIQSAPNHTDSLQLLREIGYDTTDPDKALLAFERRFMPHLVPADNDIAHLEENLKSARPIPITDPAVQDMIFSVWRIADPWL